MKKLILTLITFTSLQALMSQELKNYNDTISYMIGFNIGRNLKQEPFDFNHASVSEGLKVALTGEKPKFTDQEIAQELSKWQQSLQQAAESKASEAAKGNKEIGLKFLEENKKRPEVKTTSTGLQYEVLTMGTGAKPAATSSVTVHYEGKLLNGTIFDSSIQRGETISFGLNQVIPGWTEGLQLMPIGSKFIFYIPSNLAYGDRDMQSIPAGSTLIFTVELFEVN